MVVRSRRRCLPHVASPFQPEGSPKCRPLSGQRSGSPSALRLGHCQCTFPGGNAPRVSSHQAVLDSRRRPACLPEDGDPAGQGGLASCQPSGVGGPGLPPLARRPRRLPAPAPWVRASGAWWGLRGAARAPAGLGSRGAQGARSRRAEGSLMGGWGHRWHVGGGGQVAVGSRGSSGAGGALTSGGQFGSDLPERNQAPSFRTHAQEQKSARAKPQGTSQPLERLLGKEGVDPARRMTLHSFKVPWLPGPSAARVAALPTPTPTERAANPPAVRSHGTTAAGRKGNGSGGLFGMNILMQTLHMKTDGSTTNNHQNKYIDSLII